MAHFLGEGCEPQRFIREKRVDGAGSELLGQGATIGGPKGLLVGVISPTARGKGDRQHEGRRKAACQGTTGNKRGHGILGFARFRPEALSRV